ncbi:hypothetical protein HOP50_06g40740 [Chloropicon primus]|nr:hypothetical protein HOP50_06g40740 [Chloropicon primus]
MGNQGKTEFLPRFSVVDDTLELYDKEQNPVVVNSQEYWASVASVGAVAYAIAGLVLLYLVLVGILRAVVVGARACKGKKKFEEYENEYAQDRRASIAGGGSPANAFSLVRAITSRRRRLVVDGRGGPDEQGRLYSRCFLDTVKVATLALVLAGFVASLVFMLYGAEMVSLTEGGTNVLGETLRAQAADLRGVRQLTASSPVEQIRGEILWEDFVRNVMPVVNSNLNTLDEAYFGAKVLTYFVPSAVFLVSLLVLGYAFQLHTCFVDLSPAPLVPWLFVIVSLCLGMGLALPSLYSDVCGQADKYMDGDHSGPEDVNRSLAFANSLYPCGGTAAMHFGNATVRPEEVGVALACLELSNDFRSHALGLIQGLNGDLLGFRNAFGISSTTLPLLCVPYESDETVSSNGSSEKQCQQQFRPGSACTAGVVGMAGCVSSVGSMWNPTDVNSLVCALNGKGNTLGSQVLNDGKIKDVDGASLLQNVGFGSVGFTNQHFQNVIGMGGLTTPASVYKQKSCNTGNQRQNLVANFGKPLTEYGYRDYSPAMHQHGLNFEEMEGDAEEALLAMNRSDAVLMTANCEYTRRAVGQMTEYGFGNRCKRLDLVSTVFWIANAVLALVCALLALMLEMLEAAYWDVEDEEDKQQGAVAFVDEAGGFEYGGGAGHYEDFNSSGTSAASAPPMPTLQMPLQTQASAGPVMGYAIRSPSAFDITAPPPRPSSAPPARQVDHYVLEQPPMKVL